MYTHIHIYIYRERERVCCACCDFMLFMREEGALALALPGAVEHVGRDDQVLLLLLLLIIIIMIIMIVMIMIIVIIVGPRRPRRRWLGPPSPRASTRPEASDE